MLCRGIDVDIDTAGTMHEGLLYRTFVNARLCPETQSTKPSGAPHMLLLWMMTGGNDLFVSLCYLKGTVNLSRKILPKDLYIHPLGSEWIFIFQADIAFQSQDLQIVFLSEQDMIQFWTLPSNLPAAVEDSYPIWRELTIHKSLIVSYKETRDLKSPWAVADVTPNSIEGGEIRIYESLLEQCWTITRRLVVSSPPYPAKPIHVSHWLPLKGVISGYRMTKIYFVYKDIDWYFTNRNNTRLMIDFPNLGVPLFVSTRPRVAYEIEARIVKPVFKGVTMRQRIEFLPCFEKSLIDWIRHVCQIGE